MHAYPPQPHCTDHTDHETVQYWLHLQCTAAITQTTITTFYYTVLTTAVYY